MLGRVHAAPFEELLVPSTVCDGFLPLLDEELSDVELVVALRGVPLYWARIMLAACSARPYVGAII